MTGSARHGRRSLVLGCLLSLGWTGVHGGGLDWLCDRFDVETGDCLVNRSRCITRFGASCSGECGEAPEPRLFERECKFSSAGALLIALNVSISCDFPEELGASAPCALTLSFARGVILEPGALVSAASVRLLSPAAPVVVSRGAALSATGLGRCSPTIDLLLETWGKEGTGGGHGGGGGGCLNVAGGRPFGDGTQPWCELPIPWLPESTDDLTLFGAYAIGDVAGGVAGEKAGDADMAGGAAGEMAGGASAARRGGSVGWRGSPDAPICCGGGLVLVNASALTVDGAVSADGQSVCRQCDKGAGEGVAGEGAAALPCCPPPPANGNCRAVGGASGGTVRETLLAWGGPNRHSGAAARLPQADARHHARSSTTTKRMPHRPKHPLGADRCCRSQRHWLGERARCRRRPAVAARRRRRRRPDVAADVRRSARRRPSFARGEKTRNRRLG